MGAFTSNHEAVRHADANARAGHSRAAQALGRQTRRFIAYSVVLLLAACSSIRLGYNNADTLLTYSLDSYFDLDDDQERLARERVRELMAWHRTTQVARYAAFLEETQRKVGGLVTPEDVLAFQAALNQKLGALGEQAAPELARLALTLQPAQIDHFAEKIAKDNSKARRELVRFAGKESLDDRVKTYAERAQDWFGTLSREQLALVRTSFETHPDSQLWWLEERERRQRDLVTLLRRVHQEKPTEAVATDWLRAYFAQMAKPADPQRLARLLEFRRHNATLTAQLINSASPEQKATLAKKLRGYAEDFAALAAAAPRG